LFSSAKSYEGYCNERLGEPCASNYGFYRPDLRRIVMNGGPGLGTLTHEIVHPLIETDFPSVPIWLNEGIASLFEAPVIPKPGEIHGRKNWRYRRLAAALADPKERELVNLERLFSLDDESFRDTHEDLNYAVARYLCQWLDSRNQLWPFYQAFRDGVAADPTGIEAFRNVTGEAPENLTPHWRAWLKRL
jgi:hypothetical protein